MIDHEALKKTITYRKVWMIARTIASELLLDVEAMMSMSRGDQHKHARWCVYWVARYGLELKLAQITPIVNRDHASVLNGVRQFSLVMTEDEGWGERARRYLDNIDQLTYIPPGPQSKHPVMPRPPIVRPVVKKIEVNRKLKKPVARAISPGDATEVTWHESHGFFGSTRDYFRQQDENFQRAVKLALQESETPGTNGDDGASSQ